MNRRWFGFALLLLLPCGPARGADSPRAALTLSVVLVVSDREGAADALVKQAGEAGGYFVRRTEESLVLKVPIGQAQEIDKEIAKLGLVTERTRDTEDLGFQLDQARAKLASKQAVLGKFQAVMQQSATEGVVSVEREMTRLVEEIERLKGAIRVLENRMRFAEITVSFRFRDRAAPAATGTSSFPWLNTVNLSDLVEDFRHAHH